MRAFIVAVIFILLMPLSYFDLFAQSKCSLSFEDSKYQFIEPKSTSDSLVLNLRWDIGRANLYRPDSILLVEELVKLCSLDNKKVNLLYWEYEFDENSSRNYGKRSEVLFSMIQEIGCFEEVCMITKFEIIGEDLYDVFPYNTPKRAILILTANAP